MSAVNPYDERYRQQMDSFAPGLASLLGAVPTLEPVLRDAVMAYLLELACQAQNVSNIESGRAALLGLPREWLCAQIERYAEPLLQRNDEWEYRRLGELYTQLDQGLLLRLIACGQSSDDTGIQEAAQDFGIWITRSKRSWP